MNFAQKPDHFAQACVNAGKTSLTAKKESCVESVLLCITQLSARAVTRKGNFKQWKGNKNMFLVRLNATVGAACSVC